MNDSLTKNQSPLVSVIIPIFNQEDFLREAVESVLAQTYKNWELILVNDGSSDKSAEIAREFAEKFPAQIYFLENERNLGANAARNLGVQQAKGEFLAFLDSDDVFFPGTIERELKAFAENPDADTVCGTLECWYSWTEQKHGERDFIINLVLEAGKLYEPPALLIHNLRAGGRKPGMDCVMLKTDFARRIKIFDEDYNLAGEDQVFWAKVCLAGKVYIMPDCLAKYRQHPASTCSVTNETGADVSSMYIFLAWLEIYLREQKVTNREVWRALVHFQKSVRFQNKLKHLKKLYRRSLPLWARYRLRDWWTIWKGRLLRSAHRQK